MRLVTKKLFKLFKNKIYTNNVFFLTPRLVSLNLIHKRLKTQKYKRNIKGERREK